ncbi:MULTISPECIES: helix-turn-helix transcriptional regulator [Bacillus cereus group]
MIKEDKVFEMHNQIKKFRDHKGISQGKLEEMCNVSRQTINAIENNK